MDELERAFEAAARRACAQEWQRLEAELAARIAEADSLRDAWRWTGRPGSFFVFVQRVYEAAAEAADPSNVGLEGLLDRDAALQAAAAAGVRGTPYSCEACREWQIDHPHASGATWK